MKNTKFWVVTGL